jgi:hypothetical protein
MKPILLVFLIPGFFINCQTKRTEQVQVDSLATEVPDRMAADADDAVDRTIIMFPLDSILEISYSVYKTFENKIDTSGVNIIDRQKKRWLFDSEGPQIEANSDIRKIDDSKFVVSVYYDVPTSKPSAKKKVRIAKFDLNIDLETKTYTFSKDTLFWPMPATFSPEDIQTAIKDYRREINANFLPDSTNNDQLYISKMFDIQARLLSSFISGCDSCSVYSENLFQKYSPALFASDSDYAGEIGSVFRILKKR